MSALGDKLREIAAEADKTEIVGIGVIIVEGSLFQLAAADTGGDAERTAMNLGLSLYQATNMKNDSFYVEDFGAVASEQPS